MKPFSSHFCLWIGTVSGRLCTVLIASVLLLLLRTPVCATKAEGPFSVDVKITGRHAAVIVRTHTAAKNVELQVYGLDGLEVQGAPAQGKLHIKKLKRLTFAPNEVWIEEIDFTPGEGMSYLNVIVSCDGHPPVVRAFSIGQLSEKQKAERQRGSRVDPDGVPIRLMNE